MSSKQTLPQRFRVSYEVVNREVATAEGFQQVPGFQAVKTNERGEVVSVRVYEPSSINYTIK